MVNFTFVSHKGARPEKSELVKSHVMRESQKKRREAKQRQRCDISALHDDPPSAARPNTTRQSEHVLHHTLPLYGMTHSYSPENPYSPGSTSSNTGSPKSSRVQSRGSPRPTLLDSTHRTLNGQHRSDTEHNPIPSTNLHANANERLRIPTYPAAYHSLTLCPNFQPLNDPTDASWMPETWLHRVNEIVSHYYISFNGTGPDPRSNFTHWIIQPRASPIILLAYSLFYCAHRDLIGGILGNDHHYFKARNLQMINAALENPATALANETIVAVSSMAMYENLRGSDLAVTHQRGLIQMFEMRGGIENMLSEKGLYIGNFAMLGDILHASCSNKAALYFQFKRPVLKDIPTGTRKLFFPHSPLRVVNDPNFAASVSIPELRSSLEMLRDAFDNFEMLCMEVFDADMADKEAAQIQYRRQRSWARLQAQGYSETEITSLSTEEKVHEAIRVAGTIHFYAVVSHTQYDDEVNMQNAQRLHDVLKKLRVDFWKTAPYLYLWMLLTGGAACCRSIEQRAYFVSEISRVGFGIGFFDWQSFMQNINNFLWLQDFLRKRINT